MRKVLSLGFIALAVVACDQPAPADDRTYSVCEVLNDAEFLNGKTITVEGLFGGTQFHGYFIAQTTADDPCGGWRARYLTAPSALLLGADMTMQSQAAATKALTPCVAAYRQRNFKRYRIKVRGTVVRKSRFPLIFRRRDGSYTGWYRTGFGEDSAFPLMLVINSAACGN
jgi:hypothetical protein